MIQKTFQVGNSVAVTIPKKVLEEKRIRVGDSVEVSFESIKKAHKTGLTPDFLDWVDNYIEKNRPALEELAGK